MHLDITFRFFDWKTRGQQPVVQEGLRLRKGDRECMIRGLICKVFREETEGEAVIEAKQVDGQTEGGAEVW